MSQSLKGQFLCSLAMVLVGSTVVVSKVIGQDIEPFLATALRHAAALPIFLLLMWVTGARLVRVSLHDAVLLLVEQQGGIACHTGRASCFYNRLEQGQWVEVDAVLKSPDEIYKK